MNEVIVCSNCGEVLSPDEIHEFDGEYYCLNCLDDMTFVCDCCGNREYNDDEVTDGNISICQSCYDNDYYRCEACNRLVYRDDVYYLNDNDDDPYCYDCYSERAGRTIREYSYKPSPIFYGTGTRFLGVELEVDEGGHSNSNAKEILGIANDIEDRMYIKSDGSINDGFEMVTHPMSLQYHKEEMPWIDIMERLIDMGYLSHKTSTCGLHVHVNRSSLGDTSEEQENAVARILYFVEHHWEEMLRFSRRTESAMQRWAARYGAKENPKAHIDDAKKDYSRYRCINIQNYYTIEFRLFRGTLKYTTFIATLQLVNEICNVAVSMSDDAMTKLTWEKFINGIDKNENRELIDYLGERHLYNGLEE